MAERVRLSDALTQAARPRERESANHDIAPQGFKLCVETVRQTFLSPLRDLRTCVHNINWFACLDRPREMQPEC